MNDLLPSVCPCCISSPNHQQNQNIVKNQLSETVIVSIRNANHQPRRRRSGGLVGWTRPVQRQMAFLGILWLVVFVLNNDDEYDNNDTDNKNFEMGLSWWLRPENLVIVQEAPRVDVKFVDLVSPSSSLSRQNASYYAYVGAQDEQGNWGYIHDEQHLKRVTATTNKPQQWTVSSVDLRRECARRDN